MRICEIKLTDGRKALYIPVCPPCADTDELAKSQRVMLSHERDGSVIYVAEVGVVSSGWVIGHQAALSS